MGSAALGQLKHRHLRMAILNHCSLCNDLGELSEPASRIARSNECPVQGQTLELPEYIDLELEFCTDELTGCNHCRQSHQTLRLQQTGVMKVPGRAKPHGSWTNGQDCGLQI